MHLYSVGRITRTIRFGRRRARRTLRKHARWRVPCERMEISMTTIRRALALYKYYYYRAQQNSLSPAKNKRHGGGGARATHAAGHGPLTAAAWVT